MLSVAALVAFAAGTAPLLAQCQRAKLTAHDGAPDDRFGCAVAVSADVVVSGAFYHDHFGYNYGAVYIFERAGDTWSEVAEVAPAGMLGLVGWTVAMDGGSALLGSKQGKPRLFERDPNGVWSQVARLRADEDTSGSYFGYAVDISGDRAVVGAPYDNDLGAWSGSAYVFERDPNGAWPQVAKLLAADGHGAMVFGDAVAIDGDVIVIGAQDDNDLGNWSGSAYVFERDAAGVWSQSAKLLPHDGGSLWNFGTSVAVSDETVLVGADNATGVERFTGAAYVFEPDPNGAWVESAKLVSDDGANSDRFGGAVTLSGNVAVIGAWGDDDHGEHTGAAYVFVRQADGTWPQIGKLVADDGAGYTRFGNAVALDGNVAVIGAYYDDDLGTDSGSAYVFYVGPDRDGNGVMDVCECYSDLDGDLDVDVYDLITLLINYGTAGGAEHEDGDVDFDGDVDISDLGALLAVYDTACE